MTLREILRRWRDLSERPELGAFERQVLTSCLHDVRFLIRERARRKRGFPSQRWNDEEKNTYELDVTITFKAREGAAAKGVVDGIIGRLAVLPAVHELGWRTRGVDTATSQRGRRKAAA